MSYSKSIQILIGTTSFIYLLLLSHFLSSPLYYVDTVNDVTSHLKIDNKNQSGKIPYNMTQMSGVNIPISDAISTKVIGESINLILKNAHVCSTDEDDTKDPILLVQVHSHCSNKPQRNAIRETWGRIARGYTDTSVNYRVVLLFLVGRCSTTLENKKVSAESKLYRDIIQFNITDVYKNLARKSLLGLEWWKYFCPHSKLLLKVDDDTYLSVPAILHFLYRQNIPTSNILMGHLYTNSSVMRKGLWGVSKELYPQDKYPHYCSGTAYLMSHDIITELLHTYRTQSIPLLHIEDVFITGLLAAASNTSCSHVSGFPDWATTPSLSTIQQLVGGSLWGIHGVTFDRMYQLWDIIQSCPHCAYDQKEMRKRFQWMKNKNGVG